MSGIQLQKEPKALDPPLSVIVLATHPDVPPAVEAMQLWALDFIEKPIIDRVTLAGFREALGGGTGAPGRAR